MQQVLILKPNKSQTIDIKLYQKNQKHELYVFLLGKNHDYFELKTITEHHKNGTHSLTVIRGVLYDQSSAKLEGMIKIGPKAFNSNAFLDQKVLLIGEQAHADVRPGLEIENNEVKASHTASVGKIDQGQLFYLMSRGFPQQQAVEELVKGFFQSLIDKTDNKSLISEIMS